MQKVSINCWVLNLMDEVVIGSYLNDYGMSEYSSFVKCFCYSVSVYNGFFVPFLTYFVAE